MKQYISLIVVVVSVICLLIASVASIQRAKQFPDLPTQEPGESTTEQPSLPPEDGPFVAYTGEAHPGTGIAYRGSGANADRVIVIDAGHQQYAMNDTEPDGPGSDVYKIKVTAGTQGTVTGLAEYELNLRVALALRDVLVEQGYCVVMVRETHEVKISNVERAQLANEMGADVFIRIHANGDADAATKGAMTVCQTPQNPYHASLYEQCRLLSDTLLREFCKGTGISQRSVWETDTMTGTNWAEVPTTIVEMGFMTNQEDEATMAKDGFATDAAQALAKGVGEYFAQLTTKEPETQAPVGEYEIDFEMEASLGQSFTEVNMTMQATGQVWVRSEPSSAQGMATVVSGLKSGDRVICIGLGQDWNRVLVGGKVCYVSAAYLQEVVE